MSHHLLWGFVVSRARHGCGTRYSHFRLFAFPELTVLIFNRDPCNAHLRALCKKPMGWLAPGYISHSTHSRSLSPQMSSPTMQSESLRSARWSECWSRFLRWLHVGVHYVIYDCSYVAWNPNYASVDAHNPLADARILVGCVPIEICTGLCLTISRYFWLPLAVCDAGECAKQVAFPFKSDTRICISHLFIHAVQSVSIM